MRQDGGAGGVRGEVFWADHMKNGEPYFCPHAMAGMSHVLTQLQDGLETAQLCVQEEKETVAILPLHR